MVCELLMGGAQSTNQTKTLEVDSLDELRDYKKCKTRCEDVNPWLNEVAIDWTPMKCGNPERLCALGS